MKKKIKVKIGCVVDGQKEETHGQFTGKWIVAFKAPTGKHAWACVRLSGKRTKESAVWYLSSDSIIREKSSVRPFFNKELFSFLLKAGACQDRAAFYSGIKNPRSASKLAIDTGSSDYYYKVIRKFPEYKLKGYVPSY